MKTSENETNAADVVGKNRDSKLNNQIERSGLHNTYSAHCTCSSTFGLFFAF